MLGYQKFAKYYDLIYFDKDYEKEVDFLEEIFDEFLESNPKKILDIGCGSGGHAIPLANRGYKVVGIDKSKLMIDVARKKSKGLKDNISFYPMPMQELHLDEKFDAVVCMFSSIDYLTTYEDVQKTLRKIKNHMEEKSLFIFDFWNGHAVLENFSPLRSKVFERNGKKVVRTSKTRLKKLQNLCEVNWKFTVTDNNRTIDEFEENLEIRFFFLDEMENYLNENGFEVLSLCPFLELGKEIMSDTWNITAIVKPK